MSTLLLIKTPDRVIVRGWLKSAEARQFCGDIDKRTWARWVKDGLRVVKVGGLVLTKPEWINEFLSRYEEALSSTRSAQEVMRSLKIAGRRRKRHGGRSGGV